MVSCSSDFIVLFPRPSGPSHSLISLFVWEIDSLKTKAAFFSLKEGDVILRCMRQTAPSVVTTLSPYIDRRPYDCRGFGNASRFNVTWWMTSASSVINNIFFGETRMKVSPVLENALWFCS